MAPGTPPVFFVAKQLSLRRGGRFGYLTFSLRR
jgi:hypothetical protein